MLVSVLVFVQRTLCNTLLVSDAARSEAETKAVEINGVMQKQSTRDQIMSRGTILPYEVRCFGTFFWWSGTFDGVGLWGRNFCSQAFLFL